MATASRRRFPALLSRRNGASADEAIEGTARLGRRTKHLVKRLDPGDVAVIDHVNIDRIAAEELIATGVAGGRSTPRSPPTAAIRTPGRCCWPAPGSR